MLQRSYRGLEYLSGDRVADYEADTPGEDMMNVLAIDGPMLVEAWHVNSSAKP